MTGGIKEGVVARNMTTIVRRFALVAIAVLALNGCGGDTVIPSIGPAFAVSDGAHDGNPDFFFLTPLFNDADQSPNFEPAAFNPNLKPTVEICELSASDDSRDCIAGDPLERFAPSDVRVSVTDQLYQVDWDTDESNLDLTKLYRISVLIGTRVLGFVDVDPVLSGTEIKNLETGADIPLVDGRTLPIKFRIEGRALCSLDALACAAGTINLAQGGTVQLAAAGEDFRLDVAPNTAATIGGLNVTEVTFNLEQCPGDGIDVDLPRVGQCLRASTFFSVPGVGELLFSNRLLISMCVLNSYYHTSDETRQEGLITLHQQDGALIRALPHAEPNCETSSPSRPTGASRSGWQWLNGLVALLLPRPAYAATRSTRSTLLHIGAGGETDILGADCSSSSSSVAPALSLTTCASSSPAASVAAGSATTALALISPPRTVTDFQFALPAKMDYVDPSDAQRTAPAGTSLPTRVRVTDLDGDPVQGARVRFIDPTGLEIATALSDIDGIAQFSWTIRAGVDAIIATGRGIAAQNNYPGGAVQPFMPDISLPTEQQQAVMLQIGMITFVATGLDVDLVISTGTPTVTPTSVLAGSAVLLSPWTIFNQGTTDATNQVTSGFYLSTDPVITPSDVRLASVLITPSVLTAGHGLPLGGQTLVIPASTPPGSYYIGILVDVTNDQTESNEQNNYVSTPVTVRHLLGLP